MGAPRRKQLFQLTSPGFRAADHIDGQWRLKSLPANDIPLVYWPDGRWCHDANRYVREMFERGLSRRNRGGSLRTEVANLSHFLRFCWEHQMDPAELTEGHFCEFVRSVASEKSAKDPSERARGTEAVLCIGRAAIALLLSIARHRGDTSLVGEKGRIRAYQRSVTIMMRGRSGESKPRTVTYWHHKCFPIPDTKKRRAPISTENLAKLQGAVHRISRTPFLKLRRYVMLKVLEITGGRRAEVAALTVKSVREAARMREPMLEMITVKRKGGHPKRRLVPVTRADIIFILEYIEVHRRAVIRSTIGAADDHDFLFISMTSGRRLADNTITQEVAALATSAGLKWQSCAHMFRHRFITKLFVALIQQHELTNVDDFRRTLLDSSAMRLRIIEWTGHTSPDSLDPYIHFAFEEITSFQKSYDIVRTTRIVENFLSTLRAELGSMEGCELDHASVGPRLVAVTEAAIAELVELKTVGGS